MPPKRINSSKNRKRSVFKVYTCNICGKTGYTSKSKLERHQKRSKMCLSIRKLPTTEIDRNISHYLERELFNVGLKLGVPKKVYESPEVAVNDLVLNNLDLSDLDC